MGTVNLWPNNAWATFKWNHLFNAFQRRKTLAKQQYHLWKLGLLINLAVTKRCLGHNVGEGAQVVPINTNGATFQMKSVPSLCTSQQSARQNTFPTRTWMETFVLVFPGCRLDTATLALENATGVIAQLVAVHAIWRPTITVTDWDGAIPKPKTVERIRAAW